MANAMNSKPKGARDKGRGILARLCVDTRGNVLIIVAAAILPLLCLIGSGIDLSRAYAAQARLQVACDAASLAGRRAMNNGAVDDIVKTEVTKFFNFNFPQGSFGTVTFAPVTTQGADSTVVVTAQTSIPTSIMKIFGFQSLPLSTTCNAKQDFVNTDIVLVLDTTGSMNDPVTNAPAGSPSKISSLRAAVMALYDELRPVQTQLEAAGLRLRYGIVPYSSNVNVGKVVRDLNSNYIVSDNWDYQSRVGKYSHTETGKTKTYCDGINGSWKKTGNNNSTVGDCTYIDTIAAGGTFTWVYQQANHDVSSYVKGDSTPVPTRTPGTTVNSTWNGCIEERQTVSTITSTSGYTIPTGAYDLNIDMIPTGDKATKWKPFWPEVSYLRDGTSQPNRGSPYVACPAAAKRLDVWTRTALDTYLTSLVVEGGTYHDIGMVWGARLLSRNGIFSGDNPANFKNMPVSRFLIFLTDGALAPNTDTYTAYGVETLDQRVTGSSSAPNQLDRHKQRFKMICNATKSMNISIWVIGFDQTLDSSLTECASSASQASTSANQAQLIAKFVEIGKNIGSLRLTQ